MSISYFMCKKCKRTSAGHYTGTEKVLCGALIGFAINNGTEVPFGCGGELLQITKEKARELAYSDRN